MMAPVAGELRLESLGEIPVIPDSAAGFYKQNCMVCLDDRGHSSGVNLDGIYQDENHTFSVLWSGEVTDELKKAYADLVRATEYGACALALLLTPKITEFTGVEQAVRGTGIDYYLAPKDQDHNLIFNRATRLEVSGILEETSSNTIEGRIDQKLTRLKPEGDLATLIIVVEFSQPQAKVVEA